MLLEIVAIIPKITAITFTVPEGLNFDSKMFWISLIISVFVLLFALLTALILTVITNWVMSSGQPQNNNRKIFGITEGLNFLEDSENSSNYLSSKTAPELYALAVARAKSDCDCRCHREEMQPGLRCMDCYGELCDEGTAE